MRLKAFLGGVIALAMVLSFSLTSAAVPSNTVSYLKQQSDSNSWIVMALKAAGESATADSLSVSGLNTATDIERTILGVAAGGEDPANFKNTNLVSLLDAQRNAGQIGNVTLLNDDIFGILAYYAAGISSSDTRIQESKTFLLNNQNADGGWGFDVGGNSDTNDTALAAIALIRAGVSSNDAVISNALNYLESAQNSDGGFGISPGADSDGASTAWIISSLQAAGSDPASLVSGGNNPFQYLETLHLSDGSYKWKVSDSSGTPIITSYAAIALAGTSYPVAVYTAPSTPPPSESEPSPQVFTVDFRIEGSEGQICAGSAQVANALQVVEKASQQCSFDYVIEETSFGPYVKKIGFDEAQGTDGWLYLVNWKQPAVGAVDYQVKSNDYITWYYGGFDWKPLRLKITNQQESGSSLQVDLLVEAFDDPEWKVVPNAIVKYDGLTKSTDVNGKATLTLQTGSHTIFAQKSYHVRSNLETVTVGSNMSKSLPISANIVQPAAPPPPPPAPTPEPQVSFEVDVVSAAGGNMTFGTLEPGDKSSQTVKIKNTGDVKLGFTASVTGDSLFVNNILLDSNPWQAFFKELLGKQEANVDASLTVPANYTASGNKNGELIFWAEPK